MWERVDGRPAEDLRAVGDVLSLASPAQLGPFLLSVCSSSLHSAECLCLWLGWLAGSVVTLSSQGFLSRSALPSPTADPLLVWALGPCAVLHCAESLTL